MARSRGSHRILYHLSEVPVDARLSFTVQYELLTSVDDFEADPCVGALPPSCVPVIGDAAVTKNRLEGLLWQQPLRTYAGAWLGKYKML